jgi:protein-S-isoprenylcysteine O-methyltransferase Ste14
MIKRIAAFIYGVTCYFVFLATFLYAIGFIGNFGVPTTIDGPPQKPFTHALTINVCLLGLFAIQHSVMARRWFKEMWTRVVPPQVERSTYVLFSSLALIAMFIFWQPMGGTIWDVQNATGVAIIYGIYAAGIAIVLAATFLINHFDLFGLRQVWLYLRGQEYTYTPFRVPGMYRLVRHPLYFGWLITFWAAPVMTAAHFLFACMTTAYILAAIQFEERDLVYMHGDEYRRYKDSVPMILPTGVKQRVEGRAKRAGAA